MPTPLATGLRLAKGSNRWRAPTIWCLGGINCPFTGLPLRLRQMIDNHHGALDRLVAYLDQPRAAGDCFLPLFKRQIGPAEYGLALVEAVAHLNHLHQTGRASRHLRGDGAYMFSAVP